MSCFMNVLISISCGYQSPKRNSPSSVISRFALDNLANNTLQVNYTMIRVSRKQVDQPVKFRNTSDIFFCSANLSKYVRIV